MKATVFLLLSLVSASLWAGNYQLQYSDVFKTCNFIHDDEYSVAGLADSVKNMLVAKSEGDRACNTSFNRLHSEMMNIDRLLSQKVDENQAGEIYNETYSRYLQELTQEALLLDANVPSQASRKASLETQIDALKVSLINNQYTLQLNKEVYKEDRSIAFRTNLYNYAAGMFTALNEAPPQCIDKIGGWEQVLPAVLRVGGMVGTFMGPAGPIIGAGFTAASQLAVLLQNMDVKKSITNIDRRRNEAILACTYEALQSTACELARAQKFVSNQQKLDDIIRNRFPPGQNGEYERYYKALNLLPKISDILRSIGKMGSAVTLGENLMTSYFTAVKIDPFTIKPPDSMDEITLREWLLAMKARGIVIVEIAYPGNIPLTLEEQYASTMKSINLAKNTIDTVINILKKTQSFVDLHSELMKKSIHLTKEISFFLSFLDSYESKANFPNQYRGVLAAAKVMAKALEGFIKVSYDRYEDNEAFELAINEKGRDLFTAMSKGSVAQISAQTVLMIPEIAFQRFARPFESIEQYYLNQDIANKDDPSHSSFSDFVIHRSLQVKVVNDYQMLSGSKTAFRLEGFETTRRSFERGFKKEIGTMVKNALSVKSDILPILEGKTAAHMCALFSSFLQENYPSLFKQCWKNHKSLELLKVLESVGRKPEMAIDYTKPCFYSDYKREENGQRILFERLKDYGNKDL